MVDFGFFLILGEKCEQKIEGDGKQLAIGTLQNYIQGKQITKSSIFSPLVGTTVFPSKEGGGGHASVTTKNSSCT